MGRESPVTSPPPPPPPLPPPPPADQLPPPPPPPTITKFAVLARLLDTRVPDSVNVWKILPLTSDFDPPVIS